mmetsp:Transcript_22104/g.36576  ORF Transcript_22104/g.36576 Transcript_22104/m.36576 type:complete len:80 (+) Transcript_22104:1262-1501(+)
MEGGDDGIAEEDAEGALEGEDEATYDGGWLGLNDSEGFIDFRRDGAAVGACVFGAGSRVGALEGSADGMMSRMGRALSP